MDNSNQRVHTDQVARLFKTVQETLNDEFMGFTQNNCKVGLFATMAELVSHCSTLGELLDKAVNFYNLVSDDIPMRLSRSRGQCCTQLYNGPNQIWTQSILWQSFGW